MTPKEVIATRGELYIAGDHSGIYELYSESCELREFFDTAEDYAQYVAEHHRPNNEFKKTDIHSERIQGGMAEVCHTESFIEDGTAVTYETKSFLKLENESWKIFKEERKTI
jgi:hypothetical protein